MDWKHFYRGPKTDSVLIGGASVWSAPWKTQGEEPIEIQLQGQPGNVQALHRYFIEVEGRAHEFAAAQVSDNDWVVYVPDRQSQIEFWLQAVAYALGVIGVFVAVRGFNTSLRFVVLGSVLFALSFALSKYAKSLSSTSEA